MHNKYIITYECHDNAPRMWKVVQLEKYFDFSLYSHHFSLLSLTSLLSAPEREVTSPSDFKVVGALNCIGGVMVSMLASCAVNCGFEPQSGQTKDYWIGICCFSAKHTALTRKSKDWLAQNQDNVSEWSNMSNRGLLFQWASTIKIQPSVLV